MGFPRIWSKTWWLVTIASKELKRMKWLRKYPVLVAVFLSGTAALLAALGYQPAADLLIQIGEAAKLGPAHAGLSTETVALVSALVAGLLQVVGVAIKLWRDIAKARKLRASGIVDRRG